MTPLMALLALHYSCDVASAHAVLPRGEMQQCMANFQQIKLHFSPEDGDATQGARNRAAYLAFKSWEAEHPDLVARLRREARDRMGTPRP